MDLHDTIPYARTMFYLHISHIINVHSGASQQCIKCVDIDIIKFNINFSPCLSTQITAIYQCYSCLSTNLRLIFILVYFIPLITT